VLELDVERIKGLGIEIVERVDPRGMHRNGASFTRVRMVLAILRDTGEMSVGETDLNSADELGLGRLLARSEVQKQGANMLVIEDGAKMPGVESGRVEGGTRGAELIECVGVAEFERDEIGRGIAGILHGKIEIAANPENISGKRLPALRRVSPLDELEVGAGRSDQQAFKGQTVNNEGGVRRNGEAGGANVLVFEQGRQAGKVEFRSLGRKREGKEEKTRKEGAEQKRHVE